MATKPQATKPAAPAAKPAAKPATKPATKPAAKPAQDVSIGALSALVSSAPAAPATKPAAKPAAAPAAPAAPAAAGRVLYALRPGFRPGAGSRLFAYTAAWLQVSGLLAGGSIPRSQAVKFAGQTAIQYHVSSTGRLVDVAGAIKLAPGAAEWFTSSEARKHEVKTREEFAALIQSGKPDGQHVKAVAGFEAVNLK